MLCMSVARIVLFDQPDQPLRQASVPLLTPGVGEVLVRNAYTTLCRSDLNTYTGKRREPTPTILGHEIVGHIAALGPQAPEHDLRGQPLRVGDLVTWGIFASDPDSPNARRDMPQKGDGLFKYGHEVHHPDSTLHGGLGEYTLLRRHTAIARVDAQVPLPVLALINCAIATVAGSLRLAGDLADETVLVSGAGMLGLVACAMSKACGAARVFATDKSAARLDTARRFGADEGIAIDGIPEEDIADELAGRIGPGLHVLLEYSGAALAMETTLPLLAGGGRAVWVGATYPQRSVRIDAEQVVRRLLTLRGLHNYTPADLLEAVLFIENHHQTYPFDTLVQGGFDLDSAEAAFRHALDANPFRVGIDLR
ncbi:MAG: zinc-binding dehydrogenase [Bacteroidia bacterium]